MGGGVSVDPSDHGRPDGTPLDAFFGEIEPFEVVDDWVQPRSGAHCRRVSSGQLRGDVFIKANPDARTGIGPSAHYRTLAEIAAAASEARVVPRPLAWGSDPSYLAYEWIEGSSALDLFRRGQTDANVIVTACAELLARLHNVDPRSVTAYERVGGEVRVAHPVDRQVLSAFDLGPWNCVISSDGVATFIDVPILQLRGPEYDVARLAVRLLPPLTPPEGGMIVGGRAARRIVGDLLLRYQDAAEVVDLRRHELSSQLTKQILVAVRASAAGRRWGEVAQLCGALPAALAAVIRSGRDRQPADRVGRARSSVRSESAIRRPPP